MKKYVCAVGDSYVYGSELIAPETHPEFSHLSPAEFSRLEFEIWLEPGLRDRYFQVLDSMRFSALVAKGMNREHISFAQGGVSQEGIKMQAHLLMDHLRSKNISPSDTVWLVGITVPSRQLMLMDVHDPWWDIKKSACSESDQFIWSRDSCQTFYGNRLEQSFGITPEYAKHAISMTSETLIATRWVMNIVDTANLLISNGVEDFRFLNLFGESFGSYRMMALSPNVRTMLANLLRVIEQRLLPGMHVSLTQHLQLNDNRPGGHPSPNGHRKIAEYILREMC